jgi:hypothetical protein
MAINDYPRLPVPSYAETTIVKPKNIIKSTAGGMPVRGGTLAGGQGIIPAGCVLGYRSTERKFYVYDNAASTGEETAVAIYLGPYDANTGTAAAGTSTDQLVRLAFPGFGELYSSALSGADANAITDLGARVNNDFDSFVL